MIELAAPFRRATSEDAGQMAELVNIAGDGLPLYLWAKFAKPGQSAWDVGLDRARRGSGGFAYKNTVVREEDGKVAACLIGYPLRGDMLESPDDATPAMLVPLLELENLVPDTWYVNVLATYSDYRGKGFGSELMNIAERIAADTGCVGLSLIVSDSNAGARRLYERQGYRERDTRPIIKEDWDYPGRTWILLAKDL